MRVVLVNYGGDFAATASPEAALDGLRSLTGWAEALRDAGADVAVVQGFLRDAQLRRGGVDYRFVAGRFVPALSRRRIPWRLHRVVRRLAPDVVHTNGLLYGLQARALRAVLPRSCPLVVQHHAERPDRGLAGLTQRWGLGAADAFFFAAGELADPWRQRGLIRPQQPVVEIMEGSSRFRPIDRATARAKTHMTGDPVCLWVANLDANKDPLTVLAGFERLLFDLPAARLYMAYRHHHLLPEVRQRLAASPTLTRAVELLGPLPYERLEAVFSSADLFLQGSHREGSGYALADALACGVVPVVTDIASFRAMTAAGTVGALWPPGDPEALRQAVLAVLRRPLEAQRRAARALFEERLSFEAIGRKALAAYRELRQAATPPKGN